MTDIKILRSLCKFFPSMSYSRHWYDINLGKMTLIVTRYKDALNYSYGSRIILPGYSDSKSFVYYTVDDHFWIAPDYDIKITNMKEFLDYDDVSLVLQYGRDVLDENIIQWFNNSSPSKISLSDFDALFNLVGI